jgi:multidrug efflux pump subunit AcrA (membrane-fusion protein)
VQLERQIYSDGNNLARERAELERLDLQKQDIEREQRIDEQLKQQIELARQQELMRLELLRQEQAKQAEDKKQAELKTKEQEEIARLKVPADNFITAQHRYKLFDIAREHKEFFTKQTIGDYEYWTSRNGDIDVHKTHVNINKQSDESIKLALDVAVSQFGDKLNINGNDDFIKATIEIIANDERYSNISLDKPEHQEMLDSKRLDIEIEKAVDLDLDNIPDLDISNAPDLNLDEPKQQKKQEIEHKMDRGLGMSR